MYMLAWQPAHRLTSWSPLQYATRIYTPPPINVYSVYLE